MNDFNRTMLDILQNNDSRSPIDNSSTINTNTNNSQNNVANFIQLPLFMFIIILASVYIILIISRRILRTNKFTWLTVNICLASTFFAFIQLISIGILLSNISETTILCRSKGFIISMGTCHVMYSHCIASFSRLLCIRYPHKPLFRSCRWLLSSISMSWIVGLFIAIPYLFFNGFTCSSGQNKQFLKIYTFLLVMIIPITIVAICNIFIFRYIRQSSRRVQNSDNKNNNNLIEKRDMHVCKIILLTFCIFVIGWAPLFTEQLFVSDGSQVSSGVTIFFQLLALTSVLADVILLIYSDQPVRTLILKTCKSHCCIKS